MNKTLWKAQDAAAATGGNASGNWQADSVGIDSRSVRPGQLFVALRGERFNGHAFVADALARGAAAAMVEEGESVHAPAEKLLVVRDTQVALEALARVARARTHARIVGLTGSVGKTSTKEMLRLALSAHGETFASFGNFNNHIGTPLNLANLPPDADFGVFEMGMNHAGEISALTRQVQPEIAIITAVEAVHLEFFDSVAGIADAKSEIFEGVMPGGIAILNRDNAYFERCAEHARKRGIETILRVGRAQEAQCRLLECAVTPHGTEITASVFGKTMRFSVKALGEHWAYAALIALATAHALKRDVEKTARALSSFEEVDGRGRLLSITLPAGSASLLDDSYNASPASMKAAFAKAKAIKANDTSSKRLVALLGDMRELGETAPQLHAELAESLVACGFDRIFTAGALMEHLHAALPPALRGLHASSAAELLPQLSQHLRAGDIILVKGSHGSHMYTIAEALKNGLGNDLSGKAHAV